MIYKGKRALVFVLIICLFCFSCACDNNGKEVSRFDYPSAVHFLDVGQGDCIFINLPDGKNMLIDSGPKDIARAETVINFIKKSGTERIDYFIITHPQADHVGNAIDIINAFEIGCVYAPSVKDFRLPLFPLFNSVMQGISLKGIDVNVSDCFDIFLGDGYSLTFLSPEPASFSDGFYQEFHHALVPTEEQINAISSVVYLNIYGVRFLLMADAPKIVEDKILEKLDTQKLLYKERGLDLEIENIDFIKVAHHGSETSSSERFLSKIKPKKAIISVGGNNIYGHPSSETLKRLFQTNPDLNLLRTDVDGEISVKISSNGEQVVLTDVIMGK